jgi:hypothetical protein
MKKYIILLIIIVFLYFYNPNENFKNYENIKKSINNKKWITYSADNTDKNIYKLKLKNKKIFNGKIKKINKLKYYYMNNILVAFQINNYNISVKGMYKNKEYTIIFSRELERIKINIPSDNIVITGYGTNNNYSYPWFYILPLVFKNGSENVALIDYNSLFGNYNPLTIKVNKKYNKYLIFIFQTYMMLYSYVKTL